MSQGIEVREPQYRFGTQRVRPFVLGAKVNPLGCSRPLQRAIVDFAADQPFAQARAKLQEHYGFAIGESTIRQCRPNRFHQKRTVSWLMSIPRSAKRSSTLRSDSGYPTYIITTRRSC
jgi:hypothetical protein